MSEVGERDHIKALVEAANIVTGGSVNYAAAASFSYTSHDGQYYVTISRFVPPVLKALPTSAPEPAPAPVVPKVEPKPASKPVAPKAATPAAATETLKADSKK
jgi:hypothetical protein